MEEGCSLDMLPFCLQVATPETCYRTKLLRAFTLIVYRKSKCQISYLRTDTCFLLNSVETSQMKFIMWAPNSVSQESSRKLHIGVQVRLVSDL